MNVLVHYYQDYFRGIDGRVETGIGEVTQVLEVATHDDIYPAFLQLRELPVIQQSHKKDGWRCGVHKELLWFLPECGYATWPEQKEAV